MRRLMKHCRLSLLFAGIVGLGLAGCFKSQTRMQADEESERDKDLDVVTVGSVTEVANVLPLQVHGVGLVTGLEGTGGGTPPGPYRTMLEQQMRQAKIENVKAILDSPNNALVLVTALIPPGARKGDELDVHVTLPQGSQGTSLKGGYLRLCPLRPYEQSKNLAASERPNTGLKGHILAHAKGPLLVGLGAAEESAGLRKARIWAGGVTHTDRPFTLVLKKDAKFAKVANAIADRINLMFYDDFRRQQEVLRNKNLLLLDEVMGQLNVKFDETGLSRSTAKAMNKDVVLVNVPFAYRFNPERYLRVSRLIPLQEMPEQKARYRHRLQKMLEDPTETIRAALRYEALGKESIPALREGMKHPHPLVRFCCAESLAYLSNPAGAEELARLASEHVELQALCLKALAGLADGTSRELLGQLMGSTNPYLRCGAFRAMRWTLEDREIERKLGGELVGQAFWLHKVAPHSAALVNIAVSQRAEIILFGDNVRLVTPVKIRAGTEFTVTAEVGDDRCTVSRFLIQENQVVRKQCTLKLEDVMRTLGELGAQYPEAIDFLRKVDDYRCLTCRIMVDAQPEEWSAESLLETVRKNPDFLQQRPARAGSTREVSGDL